MSRISRSAVFLVAVLVSLAGGVLPAQAAVTIEVGHVDGAWVKYVNNQLELWVGDSSSGTLVERAPADVVLRAKPESQATVPASPNPVCMGTPGNPVWLLPQVQSENPNVLWLGWSAETIGTGVLDGNQVTLRLTSATPPPNSGGVLCVYSKSGISTTKIFDSADGLPDSVAVLAGASGHRHVNWAFTASGAWTVTFQVTAMVGGVTKTDSDTYTFSVG